MPPRKKQNGKGWCTGEECIQNVESLKPPIPDLHAFCLPTVFNKKFTIPDDVINFMKEKKRIYIGIIRENDQKTNFTQFKDVNGNNINTISLFFIDILHLITGKIIMSFEDSLIISNKIPNEKRLFSNIMMSFNLTDEGNDTSSVTDWHRDLDNESEYSFRQFSFILTHHPQTEFAIKANAVKPNKYVVDKKDIRQCSSTEPGSSSYWNSDTIHRKQLFNVNTYNNIRMIVAIQFRFNNIKIKDGLFRKILLDKQYYDSPEHRMKEIKALEEIFGNIGFPTEQQPIPNKVILHPLNRVNYRTSQTLNGGKHRSCK